jgi:hypothetical protein
MIRDIFGIMREETLTYNDIQAKKALDNPIAQMKRPFKNVADAWLGTFLGERPQDYYLILTNID